MAKKEVITSDYIWVDWSKAGGMLIGLAIAIAIAVSVVIFIK